MINLTKTTQLAKKAVKALTITLLVLSIAVGIYLRFKAKEPQPPPIAAPTIQQNPDQQLPLQIDFSKLKTQKMPTRLPVLHLKLFALNDKSAADIARILEITDPPTKTSQSGAKSDLYTWSTKSGSLTISPTSIQFKKRPTAQNSEQLSHSDLQVKVQSLVNQILGLANDLELSPNQAYLKLSPTDRFVSSSENEATIIEFRFNRNLDGYKIIGDSYNSPYTTIRITKSGEIIEFSSKWFDQFTKAGNYRILSPKEAIRAILAGQGKITQTLTLDEYGQSLELFRYQPIKLDAMEIAGVSLAYFISGIPNELIQPVYVFEGRFTKDNEQGRMYIYLPAIKNLLNTNPQTPDKSSP